MREIEFRGKRVDNGEWVYGYYFEDTGALSVIQEPRTPNTYTVDPATVGQYTGLKDKNGVEIYEDDIVHCWGDYKDGGWGFDRIIKVELTSFKLATLEDCEYKEILGNVFENPELLEMVLKK